MKLVACELYYMKNYECFRLLSYFCKPMRKLVFDVNVQQSVIRHS